MGFGTSRERERRAPMERLVAIYEFVESQPGGIVKKNVVVKRFFGGQDAKRARQAFERTMMVMAECGLLLGEDQHTISAFLRRR